MNLFTHKTIKRRLVECIAFKLVVVVGERFVVRIFGLVEIFDVHLDTLQLSVLADRPLQLLNQLHVRLERDERMYWAVLDRVVYAASSTSTMYVVRRETRTVEVDDVLDLWRSQRGEQLVKWSEITDWLTMASKRPSRGSQLKRLIPPIKTYIFGVQTPRTEIGAHHELHPSLLEFEKVVKSPVALTLHEHCAVHVMWIEELGDEHGDRLSVDEDHRLAGIFLELVAQIEQFVRSDRAIDAIEDVLRVEEQVIHLFRGGYVDVL